MWARNLKGVSITSACTLSGQTGQQISGALAHNNSQRHYKKSACMFSGQSGQQISGAPKIKTRLCAQWSLWATILKGISIKSAYMFSGQSGQQMSEALKIKPAFMLSGQCGRQISAAFQ